VRKEKMFYSVTELAKFLKVSRQAILDRIERGTLNAIKIGETYAIPEKEVARVAARRRRR